MLQKELRDIEISIYKAESPRDLDGFLNLLRAVKSRVNSPITDRHEAVNVMYQGHAYLISDGHDTVGVAVWHKDTGGYYLREFAISPSSQRRGIGTMALKKILTEKMVGDCTCSLHTHPDNSDALRLYTACGFKVAKEIPNFFGDGEPRLLLTRAPQHATI